jgi:hypothetical protein
MNLLDSVLLEQFTHEGLANVSSLLPVLCEPVLSITGTATATMGRMHLCTGTSADYTVTLPATSGNAGKFIGLRMGTSSALTKLVTVDGNASELIDEALTRVMFANESAILMSDGSAWIKIGGRTIQMIAKATTAGASMASGVYTKLPVDGVTHDNAGLINTGSGRIDIKRDGFYRISQRVSMSAVASAIDVIYFALYISGGLTDQEGFTKAGGLQYPNWVTGTDQNLDAGQYVESYFVQYSGGSIDAAGGALSVVEVPQW